MNEIEKYHVAHIIDFMGDMVATSKFLKELKPVIEKKCEHLRDKYYEADLALDLITSIIDVNQELNVAIEYADIAIKDVVKVLETDYNITKKETE